MNTDEGRYVTRNKTSSTRFSLSLMMRRARPSSPSQSFVLTAPMPMPMSMIVEAGTDGLFSLLARAYGAKG